MRTPSALLDETQQEVFRVHRLVLHLLGDLLRSLDDFLGLERELLKPHGVLLSKPRIVVLPYHVFNIKLESIHVNIEQYYSTHGFRRTILIYWLK